MRSRALGIILMWGVAIGCGSSGPSEGTGGSGGSSNGGHGGKGTGGSATGGHTGGSTGTGGAATGGNAGGTGGQAGNGSVGGAIGQGGSGGGTGGVAGGGGGHAGGGAGGGVAGSAGGGSGGSAGGGGGVAGSAGGNGGSAGGGGGVAGSAGGGNGGSAGGGAAGHTGGAGGNNAGGAGGVAAGGAGGAADPLAVRGQYLVNSVLGCTGCHGSNLAGKSCLYGGTGGSGGQGGASADCLSSPNLTSDAATGIASLSAQQIKDAFTKGIDPDVANRYLFSQMPYYQFGNLSDYDANAIVAYLRTVPAVSNTPTANSGQYAESKQPTAPQWAAVDPNALPAATTASAANGEYLATLACVTCHTVEVSGANPRHIDATKAFQGGLLITANITVNGNPSTTMVETSNLTPHATGIMGWTADDVKNAIKAGTIKGSTSKICGMRALANMTDSDATDIGNYLLGIPPVANTISPVCP